MRASIFAIATVLSIGVAFTLLIRRFDDRRHDPATFVRFTPPERYRCIDGTIVDARPPMDGLTIRVFYSIDCPIATDQLAKFVASDRLEPFESKIRTIGIAIDPAEARRDVEVWSREIGMRFPVVHDFDHAIAKSFEISRVPEWVVTDGAGMVVYRGPLDAQFADRSRRVPGSVENLLAEAIAAWFEKGRVTGRSQASIGCPLPLVSGRPGESPDFEMHVAPILARSCVPCHRAEGAAPFSLTEPGQAAKRADDIAAVAASGLMPPWKPVHGSTPPLAHDRSLTAAEIDILRRWSESVVRAGDGRRNDRRIEPPESPDDWPLGPPDLVLEMPEDFVVPAYGDDVYRCFVLPTGLTEDRFLTAVDIRPGNPRVVHHVFNYVDTRSLGRQRDEASAGSGYDCFSGFTGDRIFGTMGGWTPGHRTRPFRAGVGLSLPKGSDIVMQIHYHPTGKVERDRTRIGLYFAREPVRQSLQWVSACENPERFELAAGEPEIDFTTVLDIPLDVELHALTPHMHFLGRSIAAFAELPDGRTIPLISIPDWDFNQQETYYLREPLFLPKRSRIRILSRFDNSAGNPYNPNRPPRRVRWGEGSRDEMMIMFLALTQADQDLTVPGSADEFMTRFFEAAGER